MGGGKRGREGGRDQVREGRKRGYGGRALLLLLLLLLLTLLLKLTRLTRHGHYFISDNTIEEPV